MWEGLWRRGMWYPERVTWAGRKVGRGISLIREVRGS